MNIEDVFHGKYRRQDAFFFQLGMFCAAIIQLPKEFPELKVWPEKGDQSLGMPKLFDGPEIDLDNLEFSKKFHVRCKDKKFAYDIFHPRMMEIFLNYKRDIWFEIEKDSMMVTLSGTLTPANLKTMWNNVVALRERLPAYLFEEQEK